MTKRKKMIDLLMTCGMWGSNKIIDTIVDYLFSRGVTIQEWIHLEDDKPDDFVSVLGHMTDAGDFPAVRECYHVTDVIANYFFFPALNEFHPIDKWTQMPQPPEEASDHG